MKRNFKMTLLSLGLISTLFIGCGPDANKVADEVFEKAKIWTDKSEKIEIVQYNGNVHTTDRRTEIYTNTREKLSSKAEQRLNTTYAWENLQGMTCTEDGVTYSIKVSDNNSKITQYYSANIYCNNTKGKKFIPVVNIEKLIEVLEE